eukprot:9490751-Pyramimonas_sp.AAC.2
MDRIASSFPGVRKLGPREFDLAVVSGMKFPETTRRMVDVSRGPILLDRAPRAPARARSYSRFALS